MIILKNIRACTISVGMDIPIERQRQLGRKLEKTLLKQSIVCDVYVKKE